MKQIVIRAASARRMHDAEAFSPWIPGQSMGASRRTATAMRGAHARGGHTGHAGRTGHAGV